MDPEGINHKQLEGNDGGNTQFLYLILHQVEHLAASRHKV